MSKYSWFGAQIGAAQRLEVPRGPSGDSGGRQGSQNNVLPLRGVAQMKSDSAGEGISAGIH